MAPQTENHLEIVSKALATKAQPSRDVCDSVAVLSTKLDALKRQGGLFERISFSPDVEAILDGMQVLS